MTSKDSSQICISDSNSDDYNIILKKLIVNADTLDSSYSISSNKTLLKNYGDTVKEYSNWEILFVNIMNHRHNLWSFNSKKKLILIKEIQHFFIFFLME